MRNDTRRLLRGNMRGVGERNQDMKVGACEGDQRRPISREGANAASSDRISIHINVDLGSKDTNDMHRRILQGY